MKLLYITYIDFGDFQSGSSVRPQRMYQAFQECGCDITLLQTQQNRMGDRRKAVREIFRQLNTGYHPDFCYVESPSGPIFQPCDLSLLRRIHKMRVPIGYFYRDAYFKFAHLFGQQNNKTIREKVIACLSNRDLRFLKRTVDIVYFPTETMAKYFDFPRTAALPPACIGSLEDKRNQPNHRRCIYVGGVNKSYGTDTMLSAFSILNRDGVHYPLTLVCRKSDASFIPDKHREAPWLTVLHASGRDQLSPLYHQANVALRPVEKNEYNDFAFSVKLTEYMEYGLPVVSVDTVEAAAFIRKNQTGLVCRDDPNDLAEKVRIILKDQQTYSAYAAKVVESINGNTWTNRAQTVMRDLTTPVGPNSISNH